jgi:branched-chain amino acid aminotransferase
MGIESEVIWFDGEFVPFAEANVHVLSHTLHYGLGVFEGIRAYAQPDGRAGVWRLREHLKRFIDSCKMMRHECAFSIDTLEAACLETLRRNGLSEAYIRPLAFLGSGAMGLGARSNQLHVVIAVWKWGAYMGDEGLTKGVRLMTSSYMRHHPNSSLQRAKVVGHYVNSILARYEADDAGFDEALMLDQNGLVAEGTGENVFVVEDGAVVTPPAVNILPGITRRSVLEILRHEGIDVSEQFFGRDAFYTADEAFMVGTAAEVTPIRELDRRAIGTGEPGPVTQRVQEIYLAAVRGEVDWLTRHITRGH